MAGLFGFMNRFYYGKAGQADYTPDRLPANRRALFFEMLRIRFSGIMGVNLLYLLFCLPAILWTAINIPLLYGEAGADFFTGGYMMLYLLILAPCLGLCGVGATGEMYILRNWARDQHAFVMDDFKSAIRENWKNGLICGLIGGLSLLTGYVCNLFYGQMAVQSVFFLLPQMISLLICVIWWMMNMLIFPMMVTYDMKLRHLIRNSFIMVIARLPWSLLFLVGSVAPPALIFLFAPVPYNLLALGVIYLAVGFGLTGFVYASYANSCFDKFLNPRIPGAKVNMGLRQEEEEEEDIDDPNPVI